MVSCKAKLLYVLPTSWLHNLDLALFDFKVFDKVQITFYEFLAFSRNGVSSVEHLCDQFALIVSRT